MAFRDTADFIINGRVLEFLTFFSFYHVCRAQRFIEITNFALSLIGVRRV